MLFKVASHISSLLIESMHLNYANISASIKTDELLQSSAVESVRVFFPHLEADNGDAVSVQFTCVYVCVFNECTV